VREEPLLLAEGVRHRYRRKVAVDGVSLAVEAGSIVGLLGPDGSGKSTLLLILAGLLRPTAGRVRVAGVDVVADPERVRPHLGFMAQGLGQTLYESLSVRENLEFFARLRGVDRAARAARMETLLSMVRLTPFQNRLAGRLSGGMKQKLALCCTLISEPELLILDEPTTGVDPLSRRDFWTILGHLARGQGKTIVLATSYMDEAERCDATALMHQGRVLAQGPPGAVRVRMGPPVVEVHARRLDAAAALEGWGARHVRIVRGRPRAMAPGPEAVQRWRRDLPADSRVAEARLEIVPPTLEDVFLFLTEGEGAGEPGTEGPGEGERPRPGGPVFSGGGGDGPTPLRRERNGAAIDVGDLTKRFGPFTAVDRVTFQVRHGEVFGFLGPNGSGKITTIKMLCGILPPTAGRGMVAGESLARGGQRVKARLGYMSQRFSLYQDLTVRENLDLYAGLYRVPRGALQARRAWVLRMAGLEGNEGTLAGDLPMGVRQRLALGCAVIHRPEILFLDEPTSGVDPAARLGFWRLIRDLSRGEGVTVPVTTHYLDEAEHCDTLGLLHMGRLVGLGSPEALRREVGAEAGRALEVVSEDPVAAWAHLHAAYPGLAVLGSRLRLVTRRVEAEAAAMRQQLQDAGVQATVAESPLTLEDVFVHLIEREERRHGVGAADPRPR